MNKIYYLLLLIISTYQVYSQMPSDEIFEKDPELVKIDRGKKISNVMMGVGIVGTIGGFGFALLEEDNEASVEFGANRKESSTKDKLGVAFGIGGLVIGTIGYLSKLHWNKKEFEYYDKVTMGDRIQIFVTNKGARFAYNF